MSKGMLIVVITLGAIIGAAVAYLMNDGIEYDYDCVSAGKLRGELDERGSEGWRVDYFEYTRCDGLSGYSILWRR